MRSRSRSGAYQVQNNGRDPSFVHDSRLSRRAIAAGFAFVGAYQGVNGTLSGRSSRGREVAMKVPVSFLYLNRPGRSRVGRCH